MIDRELELSELRALSQRKEPSLALLYGRRRVGKTYLLEHVWGPEERFYFLLGDTTPAQNRRELLSEFSRWSGEAFVPEDYPTWRTLLRLLLTYERDRPLVIVLDEFQYLMEHDEGIPSQLNAVWDREVSGRSLTVVLSGSEVSTMSSLSRADSPLYGRLSWSHRLRAFDYHDAARMVPHLSRVEQIYAYGIFGGLPRYLASVREDEPLEDAVVRSILSKRGEVHLQLENLLAQERGIRDPSTYRAVLAAVARGASETYEIAQAAGLQGNLVKARRALETLEDLELIRRERNFDASSRAGWRNRIADNAVAFWYRFVESNRSRLELGGEAEVWTTEVAPQLDTYMGKIFEQVVAGAFARHHARWNLASAVEWSRWEGQDWNRRPIELDIVARLVDERMLTGEVNWSPSPVGPGVHRALMRDLDDLSRSGQSWAKDALGDDARFLYVSAAGFNADFEAEAVADERIIMVDLEDLFEDGD